jgi:hypothetical protein
MMNATAELVKWEGLAYNPEMNKVIISCTRMDGNMLAGSTAGLSDDIRQPINVCGVMFSMQLDQNFNGISMEGFLAGLPLDATNYFVVGPSYSLAVKQSQSLSLTCTRSHSLALTRLHSLSLACTRSHSLALALIRSHSLSLACSPSLLQTLAPYSVTRTLTRALSLARSHLHSLAHCHSCYHTHTRTHTHTHTHTCMRMHTHPTAAMRGSLTSPAT